MTRRRILLKIEIFALIFAVLLSSVTFVVKIKAAPEDTSSAISPFYDEAFNSLDAIFFGTSHMLNGLLPLELYRNYGIASFNYAQHGQSFPLTYESIKETTRFQKPQILVVDLYGMVAFDFARNWNSEYSWLHYVTDNIPFVSKFYLAKNYLEYRNDTFNNFYEIMFPFYLYHSRWEEISLVDYFVSSTQKGAIPLFSIFNANSINSLTNERELLPYKWEQKILNIIDFCENKRIELLFIVIPYGNIDKKSYCYYNAVEWLIKGKKHIGYLNYFYFFEQIDFDLSTDLANIGHLNFYGAQKITAHLGKYIKEHYDIPDRRLDPAYAKWNDDYKLYVQDTFARELNATRDSEKYVQLIASKKEAADNTCMFVVKTLGEGKNSKYFQTLGLNVTGNNYIAVLDSGKVVYQQAASDVPLMHEYKIGKLPVKLVSDVRGTSCIKVDGIEQVKNKSEMTVVIYDKLLKKITSVRNL